MHKIFTRFSLCVHVPYSFDSTYTYSIIKEIWYDSRRAEWWFGGKNNFSCGETSKKCQAAKKKNGEEKPARA